MTHPVLPTQEQFAEWDSEYFDGERQNFDVMMSKAFQAGADWQLKKVLEWLDEQGYYFVETDGEGNFLDNPEPNLELMTRLMKAMRPPSLVIFDETGPWAEYEREVLQKFMNEENDS